MSSPQNAGSAGSYSARVVAFVDILGFADLVKRADRNPSLREAIIDALRNVRSFASPTDSDTDLRAQNFSDSLIVSAVNTPDGLWHLALSLDSLAWNLLNLGLLVRGAITIGGVHQDDEIVFGVGVNEAYQLESKIARFPRIIFSRSALSAADKWGREDEIWKTYHDSRLRRGQDGVWHLNILTEMGCFSRQQNSPGVQQHPFFAQGELMHGIIQSMLDQAVEQPEVYSKVEWFARYWNDEVATSPSNGQPTIVGRVRLAGEEEGGPTLPFRAHGAGG